MIIFKLSNHMIPENASDFRLIDRKVYTIINSMKEKNKFLRGLVVGPDLNRQVFISNDNPVLPENQKQISGRCGMLL